MGDRENPSQMPTQNGPPTDGPTDLKKWEIPSPFFSRKKRTGRKNPHSYFFVCIGTGRMHQPSPDRKKRCFWVVPPLRHFLLLSYASPVTPTQRRGGNGAGREGKQEWINSDPMPLALLIQVGGEMFLGHFLPFVLDYAHCRDMRNVAPRNRGTNIFKNEVGGGGHML